MKNKKTNEPNPQGGKVSTVDCLISVKEMCSYDDVVLDNLCDTEDKTDTLVPSIGIKKSVVLTGEMVQIPIDEILISKIHLKLYESDLKRDKINELKDSIKEIGQLQPIIIALFMGQNYLLDGRIRLIAMKELGYEFISVIISPSVNDGDTLDNLVLQYHIRKELTAAERLNEIIEILQIGRYQVNKYIGIDKRRDMVSKKLGRGFSRSNVIDLSKIIEFELENDFGHTFSTSILEGKMKVSDGLTIIQGITELDYTKENEKESCIVKSFLDKKINVEKTIEYLADYKKKKTPLIEYPRCTGSYEIRQGNIFEVDLTDQTFDDVFSSPPYALQRKYGDKMVEVGVEKNVDDYIKNICDAFEKCYNQLTETGSLIVNLNDTWKDGFSLNVIERFVMEMDRRGIRKVQWVFWEKPNPKPQGDNVHRYVNKFEFLIHFAKTKDYTWNKLGKRKSNLKVQSGCSEVGSKKKGHSLPSVISACSNLFSENMMEGIDGLSEIANSIKNNPMILKRQFEKGEIPHTATFNMLLPLIPLKSTLPTDRQGTVCDPFAGTSSCGETAMALGHKFFGIELYDYNCKTSARVLSQAEEMFKDVNLMDELFESEVEILNAA